MANNKAAKKRIKTNKRNRIENNSYKSLMTSSRKKCLNQVDLYTGSSTDENKLILMQYFNLAISHIDKAAKKNVIHKNTAARKKSNLYKNTFVLNK